MSCSDSIWSRWPCVETPRLTRCVSPADIVEIKHILLPTNQGSYKDIYVVFELMETDLHQVRMRTDPCT